MTRTVGSILVTALVSTLVLSSPSFAFASPSSARDEVEATVATALDAVGQGDVDEMTDVPAGITVGDASASYRFGGAELRLTPVDQANSVIVPRSNGFQALTVLQEGATVADFALDLPPGVEVVADGSGLRVRLAADGFVLDIAAIGEPWALDAQGQRLETSYELDDGVIRQRVDTSDAVYPVVADPLLTIGLGNAPQGPGVYLNLSGEVMNGLLAGVLAAANITPAAICVSGARIPHPLVRSIVMGLCGFFGYATVNQAINEVASALQASPWQRGTCSQMRLPGGGSFVATSWSNCA